jgi:hypothetical protein
MTGLRAVDWVVLDRAAPSVKVGDLLSVEAGGMPIFQVTAVSGALVSLSDGRQPKEQVKPLECFRWRGVPARA